MLHDTTVMPMGDVVEKRCKVNAANAGASYAESAAVGGNSQVSDFHTKCECHDCTQARWKMSFQYQLGGLQ